MGLHVLPMLKYVSSQLPKHGGLGEIDYMEPYDGLEFRIYSCLGPVSSEFFSFLPPECVILYFAPSVTTFPTRKEKM